MNWVGNRCPCVGDMTLKHLQASQGFQVCLILKYYLSALQPHSPDSPVRVQWEDLKQRVDLVLLLACNVFLPKICSRTGWWGCECYPSDCSLVPDNFLEGAVATMWLLPSSGLTGFSKRFQFCHPRLSHCPNALDKKFVSCIGPQIPQQSPGRASVYPPLQSIKRSLNVKHWSVYLKFTPCVYIFGRWIMNATTCQSTILKIGQSKSTCPDGWAGLIVSNVLVKPKGPKENVPTPWTVLA